MDWDLELAVFGNCGSCWGAASRVILELGGFIENRAGGKVDISSWSRRRVSRGVQ